MEDKKCKHLKTDVRINREFLKSKKIDTKAFECLGKFFFLWVYLKMMSRKKFAGVNLNT
jgi:hypothetical protein